MHNRRIASVNMMCTVKFCFTHILQFSLPGLYDLLSVGMIYENYLVYKYLVCTRNIEGV